jgi:ABC-2 type transport system permease protein
MAGVSGSRESGAGANGAELAGAGMLSRLARQQYAALAEMRWRMFKNSLRSNRGVLELGARSVSYIMYAIVGLGLCFGLGAGAYAMMTSPDARFLPILFWAVLVVWQMLPVALASFQEQFDLGILLRFPLSFSSYMLLYVIFGLVDVSTITGGLCCLGLWMGITVAKPGLFAWTALALVVFAAFNILLVRAIFAWIDRWMAQRRTREIVGAIFLVVLLSMQLLNPALRQNRRGDLRSRAERTADRQKTAAEFRPWLKRVDEVQRWLPPGLAAQAVRVAGDAQAETALNSLGLLAVFALAAGLVLAARLKKEYAGESLGEAPGRRRAASGAGAAAAGQAGAALSGTGTALSGVSTGQRIRRWIGSGSGPIGAIMEKEFRSLLRTLPLLYAVGAPLLLVLVFSGIFVRNNVPSGRVFQLALPVCLVYSQLGFTQLFYNSLGTEGTGIQLYFLSPTPMRTVLLAKNLFHSMLFAVVALTAGILAGLRLGMPETVVIAASVGWVLFTLPCNLAAGNIFSLTMPYRVNPGRITRQRGSQASALLSLLVQLGVIAIGAAVFSACWALDRKWVATVVFLALAAVAAAVWRRGLRNADALANRHKDELIATLARTD